jgi:hypothetical protein
LCRFLADPRPLPLPVIGPSHVAACIFCIGGGCCRASSPGRSRRGGLGNADNAGTLRRRRCCGCCGWLTPLPLPRSSLAGKQGGGGRRSRHAGHGRLLVVFVVSRLSFPVKASACVRQGGHVKRESLCVVQRSERCLEACLDCLALLTVSKGASFLPHCGGIHSIRWKVSHRASTARDLYTRAAHLSTRLGV